MIGGMSNRTYESGPFVQDPLDTQGNLFPLRLVSREYPPNGAHIRLSGKASDGNLYFCKDDRSGEPIRMREAFYSQLCYHLNIPTPRFMVIEDDNSETHFGSQKHVSTEEHTLRKRFLRTERRDDLGRCMPFPGRILSQLYAFDLFICNSDRSADNIVLHKEGSAHRLCPIDFAAAELGRVTIDQFPVEMSETYQIGILLRQFHGFFLDSALELVDRIEAIPLDVIASFFAGLPPEWINVDEREALGRFWDGPAIRDRLNALRAGLSNGHLL